MLISVGFVYEIKYGMDKQKRQQAENIAEKTIKNIMVESEKGDSEKSRSERYSEAATDRTMTKWKSLKTTKDKMITAAHIFFGNYHTNTRGRKEYCKEHNIDIGRFVTAFKNVNDLPYKKSIAIYNSHSTVTPEEMWIRAKNHLRTVIDMEMQDLEKNIGGSISDACQYLNTHADEIALNMKFSETSPEAYAALLEISP